MPSDKSSTKYKNGSLVFGLWHLSLCVCVYPWGLSVQLLWLKRSIFLLWGDLTGLFRELWVEVSFGYKIVFFLIYIVIRIGDLFIGLGELVSYNVNFDNNYANQFVFILQFILYFTSFCYACFVFELF